MFSRTNHPALESDRLLNAAGSDPAALSTGFQWVIRHFQFDLHFGHVGRSMRLMPSLLLDPR